MADFLSTWAGWISTVVAGLSALGTAFKFGRPLAARHVRAYRTAFNISEKWGPNAGEKLRQIVQDMSRERAQISLRVDVIARKLNVGVYVCDATGRITYASEQLVEMFGLDSTQMLGLGWLQAVDDKSRALADVKFAYDNGVPYESAYVITNVRTGEKHCCSARAYPVNADGLVTEHVGFVEFVYGESGRCPYARGGVSSCPMTRGQCPLAPKSPAPSL